MTAGYTFAVTCPRCGGPLHHETSSRPTDLGTRVTAIAKCDQLRCKRRWQIVTEIMTAADFRMSELP